jgi:secreted PhoX family phosphatase
MEIYMGRVVTGFSAETDANYPAVGTSFWMANLGHVEGMTGAQLETASNAAGVARFLRPEDGAWDPVHPNDFYFVTTNGFSNPSRLWKLHFNDLNNLPGGGTITVLLNGTEGQKMFDNIAIDNSGHILLQEDVGNNEHIGKIWQYTMSNGELKMVAQHDSLRFKPGAPLFHTRRRVIWHN